MEASLALLGEASDAAVMVARQDLATRDAPAPPAALRPLLRFDRLPARARSTVRDVLDRDEQFRARVRDRVDEQVVDRATWLFLDRPEGWAQEFGLLVSAQEEAADRAEADRAELAAERKVQQLEQALERTRDELEGVARERDEAVASSERERDARRASDRTREELERSLAGSEQARRAAVQQLTEARALAESRLEQARAVSEDLAGSEEELTGPPDRYAALQSSAEAARAVARAVAAADELGAALADAGELLGAGSDSAPPAAPEPPAPPASSDPAPHGPASRRGIRRPVRLIRGAVDGSREATEQILRTAGVIVVVDGYNMSMEGWSALGTAAQRERLVAFLSDVRKRTGAEVHVVFDGDDDGSRPSVSTPLPVRVHFTRFEVEADDVVLDFVDRWPADRAIAVVSSDRRVRTGAQERGANVIHSGDLLDWGRR